jgi:integrase
MARAARRGRLTDALVEKLTPRPDGREAIVRDGIVPGFLIRCGRRKKSFEVRIERKDRPKVFETLGHWPTMNADEARAAAHDILARFERREPITQPRHGHGEMTIAIAWPLYRARLIDDGASPRTLEAYRFAYNRLSEDIRHTPLRELAANPILMADEVARIRQDPERLKRSRRGGQAAAAQSARFVSSLFTFARKRDPCLSGNPVSAVSTVDPKRHDLRVLAAPDLPAWWQAVQNIPRERHREAHLFALLSGLRRETLVSLEWKYLDLKRRCIRILNPKGGPSRSFDLIVSRAMIRCLWRARRVGRRLYPAHAQRWVFAGPKGHIRGDTLTKDGLSAANHDLRRTYASLGRAAGVPRDSIKRLLNHSTTDITDHYIRDTALGRLHAVEQETISAHIVKALGSRRGLE